MKTLLITIALFCLACSSFAESQDAASRERWRVLVDTNDTTSLTLYTASGAGQLLVGKAGGTNRVYMSTAAGTNSWKQVVTD